MNTDITDVIYEEGSIGGIRTLVRWIPDPKYYNCLAMTSMISYTQIPDLESRKSSPGLTHTMEVSNFSCLHTCLSLADYRAVHTAKQRLLTMVQDAFASSSVAIFKVNDEMFAVLLKWWLSLATFNSFQSRLWVGTRFPWTHTLTRRTSICFRLSEQQEGYHNSSGHKFHSDTAYGHSVCCSVSL